MIEKISPSKPKWLKMQEKSYFPPTNDSKTRVDDI